MSRYQTDLDNGRSLAWGYDYKRQEYFIQEYYTMDESMAIDDANEAAEKLVDAGQPAPEGFIWKDPEVVFSIMTHSSSVEHPAFPGKWDWSNSEILELMKTYIGRHSHPEFKKHLTALALDLTY